MYDVINNEKVGSACALPIITKWFQGRRFVEHIFRVCIIMLIKFNVPRLKRPGIISKEQAAAILKA